MVVDELDGIGCIAVGVAAKISCSLRPSPSVVLGAVDIADTSVVAEFEKSLFLLD